MQAIVKYKATDGSEWNTAERCERRDALNGEIVALEARIGPRITTGRGAIDPGVVSDVKAAVVDICRREFPEQSVFQHEAAAIHPMSFAGRFLDEVGGPIARIWYRFACISGPWEYEQPYYALNPGAFEKEGR
jgi:hypothetical protein